MPECNKEFWISTINAARYKYLDDIYGRSDVEESVDVHLITIRSVNIINYLRSILGLVKIGSYANAVKIA